ncbi:MAG: hypothetical protein ABSA82_03045 [Thermacetogeniaceae bacterium]
MAASTAIIFPAATLLYLVMRCGRARRRHVRWTWRGPGAAALAGADAGSGI